VKINPQNGATDKFAPEEAQQAFDMLQRWPEHYDTSLAYEVHTDKRPVKFVPCLDCKRAMMVTTFYVPAWAHCSRCSGSEEKTLGSIAIPQRGRTNPELAKNLADVLINEQFAEASCPMCGEDMELKSVSHNANYGPRELMGYDKQNGRPIYKQLTGEIAMHQCNKCLMTVTFSTVHVMRYRRLNEPKVGRIAPLSQDILGPREDADERAA
jgi:hypothetical protein